jgi:hypothetical protein
MARITKSEVESRVDLLNQLFENNGSIWHVKFSHRYNYFVIDRMIDQDTPYSDPLVAGTLRECYNYLCGMLRSLDMYTETMRLGDKL